MAFRKAAFALLLLFAFLTPVISAAYAVFGLLAAVWIASLFRERRFPASLRSPFCLLAGGLLAFSFAMRVAVAPATDVIRTGRRLVLDSAEDPALIRTWAPTGEQGHLLITSRSAATGSLAGEGPYASVRPVNTPNANATKARITSSQNRL